MAFVPFSDSVSAANPFQEGHARLNKNGAFVRVSVNGIEELFIFRVNALGAADSVHQGKGHVAPLWGVADTETLPCLSPFWLSFVNAVTETQMEELRQEEVGAGLLRARVTTMTCTEQFKYQPPNHKEVLGVSRLKKPTGAKKTVIDIPVITNVEDVEAGTPLYLVL